VIKILRLTPPMRFSALKPGPVVPPGIEKTPDQAARISQSVDFGQLSDILAILGGCRFLTLFWHFFSFTFLSFSHFSDFMILTLFHFFWFCWFSHFLHFCIFDHFLSFFTVVINLCHFLSLNYVPQRWHTFLLANLHSHYPPFW